MARQRRNILGYWRAGQEDGAFIREVIAVVVQEIIRVHGKPRRDFLQEFQKHVLRDVRFTEWNVLDWDPVGRASRRAVRDPTSKEELFIVHNDSRMPYTVDLLAEKRLRHLLGVRRFGKQT